MSTARYLLLVGLIPLFGVFMLGFTIGPVELGIWLVLFAAWVFAFVKARPTNSHRHRPA